MKFEGLTMNQLAERNAVLVQALEKAREVTNCPDGVDLQDHLKQLVAENLSMKAICDDRRMFIMNGVQLGYIQVPTMEVDPALETIRIAVSPQEPTPATESILRESEARGVEKFASHLRTNDSGASPCKLFALGADDFASQLREGKAE